MIAPQPHAGGLSALNPKPWAGPRAGSPRTSGPGPRHYPPESGSDRPEGRRDEMPAWLAWVIVAAVLGGVEMLSLTLVAGLLAVADREGKTRCLPRR